VSVPVCDCCCGGGVWDSGLCGEVRGGWFGLVWFGFVGVCIGEVVGFLLLLVGMDGVVAGIRLIDTS
jgi:hypothetical protein